MLIGPYGINRIRNSKEPSPFHPNPAPMSAGILSANCETSQTLVVSRRDCTTLSGVVLFLILADLPPRRVALGEAVGRPSLARLESSFSKAACGTWRGEARAAANIRFGEWRVKRNGDGETAAA